MKDRLVVVPFCSQGVIPAAPLAWLCCLLVGVVERQQIVNGAQCEGDLSLALVLEAGVDEFWPAVQC